MTKQIAFRFGTGIVLGSMIVSMAMADQPRRLENIRQEIQSRIDERKGVVSDKVPPRLSREAAWNRYYQRPSHCDDAVGKTSVECGNHYIRAKRKFDELYDTGKL